MKMWALILCWRYWPRLRIIRMGRHCQHPACQYYECRSMSSQLAYWRRLQAKAKADRRADGFILMRSPGRWQHSFIHACKPITHHSAATIIRMLEAIRDDWYAANAGAGGENGLDAD